MEQRCLNKVTVGVMYTNSPGRCIKLQLSRFS